MSLEIIAAYRENEYDTEKFLLHYYGPSGKKVRGGDSRKMKIYKFFIVSGYNLVEVLRVNESSLITLFLFGQTNKSRAYFS